MEALRILAIGNSLAENPMTQLQAIAASCGHPGFKIGHATLAGCPLAKHWRIAEHSRQHPAHKTYDLVHGGAAVGHAAGRDVNLQEALASDAWDLVILNHSSLAGPRRETWEPWLGQLLALVRGSVPGVRTALNMTWAYREDSSYLLENGLSSDSMFALLRDNYIHFAAVHGCAVIPTGEAVQLFRRSPGRRFIFPDPDFDYMHAQPPALPRQEHSLSVGWTWSINDSPDGVPRLSLDFNHLNTAGLYLAGCTWAEALTGLDVRRATALPDGLEEGLAADLRALAHEACVAHAKSLPALALVR